MSCSVRLFAYSGIVAIPWAANNQLATNAAYVFKEPYLSSANITANTSTAQATSSALSPSGTSVLRVEVQKGNVIHYEVSRASQSVTAATTNSPTIEGKDNVQFGPGDIISILQAGSEA